MTPVQTRHHGYNQPSMNPKMVQSFGQILAISYPVLAVSACARAIKQLFFKPDNPDPTASVFSAVAGLLYIAAVAAFVVRKPWAWYVSVVVLLIELVGVLVVGTAGLIKPLFIGHTVWQNYGQGYGWLPLIQPILGLIWLFSPNNKPSAMDSNPKS